MIASQQDLFILATNSWLNEIIYIILYRMQFTKTHKILAAIFALFLVAVVGAYVYSRRNEYFGSPLVVEYYYMNGCPWCDKFMPEWDTYQQQASAQGVTCRKIEASDAGDALSKYGIKGFPTVIIIRDGQASEYEGDRTAAALMKATDISASQAPVESPAPLVPRAAVLSAN
jgi:thiol-disulfide isomerase/thioredoxin